MRKLAAALLVVAISGCAMDPSDPRYWIKKLDDPREQKEAVRMLVKLKDKQAVPPLMELFKKTREPSLLKDIASFDDPRAVPLFIEQLDYSEDSFEGASVAASALGELKAKEAVDALSKAVVK